MGRTVLIVDDSGVGRMILAKILKKEYNVLEAASGEEALAVLQNKFKLISAVVLDIVMPGMDGYEVLRRIRANAIFLQIPVIIATGMTDEETQEKAITLGANGFITKPYNSVLLMNTLQNAISLREHAALANSFWKDKLTGLLAREAFFVEAKRILSRRENGSYVLSCVDIDNFKVVNDQYGMEIGDEVLRYVGSCFNDIMSKIGGIGCRFSEDKFALLYPAQYKDSPTILDHHKTLTAPTCLRRTIRIRVGRYLVQDKTVPINIMLDLATMAEESIKGRYDVYIMDYRDELRASLLREQLIVNDMESALANGEFVVWLQPQVNHVNGTMIGAEALVRWYTNGSFISPAEFIPVFERNGFIYELDQYIWEQVCILLKRWISEGRAPLPVSVNISRVDIYKKDFLEKICGIVEKYELPIELLRLEITESAFADQTKQIVQKVGQLIEYGFTVEIDDFGSGYSSLNTLKDVPASILKLDMRFFENTEHSQRGGNIVESVVRMAKWLGMAVIAEGVEEREQADYLKSIGCFYIQGCFYARPMPVADYEALMQKSGKEPKLSRLQTVDTWDNNAFWDPKSMETLVFNSYVGGACIFEFSNGKTEILRFNDEYEALFNGPFHYDYEKGNDSTAFLDVENRTLFFETIQTVIQSKKESTCEVRLTDGKGHFRYLRTTMRAIAKTAERYLFYAVVVNVTEQHEAEQKRLEAEKRELESAQQLQVIMENINGGVSAILIEDDGSSRFAFNNDRYYELYGYTREQAVEEKLDVMRRIVPEDFESVMEKVRQLKRDRKSVIIDYRCIKRDGTLAYLRANASIMSMKKYGDDVITSVLTDITEKRKLEEQLRAIIDNIYGGVTATVLRDGQPEFIVSNDRFFQMLGYETREEYKKNCPDKYAGLHPDDRARIIRQFTTSDGGKTHYTMEYRIVRKDGEIRYIQNNISVIHLFGVEGPVQLSVTNDVTELRVAQQKEQAVSTQLQTIMANIQGGIAATLFHNKNDVEIVFCNNMFYEMYGYTKEQMEQEVPNMLDLIYPEDREKTMETVGRIVRERGSETYEYRCHKRDGGTVWVRVSNSVISLEGIGDTVLLAVVHDVTALRAAQQKERSLSTQMQAILANVNGGVTASIIEGKDEARLIFSNDYFYQMYGYTKEQYEAEVSSAFDLVHPDDLEFAKENIARVLAAHGASSYEFRCIRRDGSTMWQQCNNSVIMLEGYHELVLLAVASDVTELHEAEQKLSATTDKLRTVLNYAGNGITAVALDSAKPKLLFANEKYFEIFGCTREEYEKQVIEDPMKIVFQEDREKVYMQAKEASRTKRETSVEYRIHHRDGKVHWIVTRINVVALAGVDVPVQIGAFADITAEKEWGEQLRFVNETAHEILAQPDSERAILDIMQRLQDYFGSGRIYIMEDDRAQGTTSNTYELCAKGVSSRKQHLQKLPIGISGIHLDKMVVIQDVEQLPDSQMEFRELLREQGVQTALIAPLYCDGLPIGCIGMDNPTELYERTNRLPAVGDYLAILLTRRDLHKKISRDHEMMQMLINDTPGGFLRMAIHADANPTIVGMNDGFCRMLGMTRDEVMRAYGDDAYRCLVMEDIAAASKDSAAAFAEIGQFSTKCRLRQKNGAYLWALVFGRFVCNEQGNLFLNSYFTDITEERKADQAQKDLLDNLPCGAALYEFDGKNLSVIHINRHYWELVEREPVDCSEVSIFGVIHEKDQKRVEVEIKSAIREKRNAELDIRILSGNGDYKPFHVVAKIKPEKKGRYRFFTSYTPILQA